MEKEKREMAEEVREKTEEEECKKQKIRIEFSLKMLLFFLEKKLKTDFFFLPPACRADIQVFRLKLIFETKNMFTHSTTPIISRG